MNVASADWRDVAASLDERGFTALPRLLTPEQCGELTAIYDDEARFRSRIDMGRFRFGAGEYKYFAAPLPDVVRRLREELYQALAPIANGWNERLDGGPERPGLREANTGAAVGRPFQRRRQYPPTLAEFLDRCHRAGQKRPTPLLLRYDAGGYNCLHQDLYGELAFPLQVVFLLSRPDVDFTGGELLLVEQRPRAQSRGHAIRIEQGAGVVFATSARPVAGSRGDYRVVMRHGVSTVLTGRRMTLGIIFHDAK